MFGLGSFLNFFGSLAKLPAKALGVAQKSIKGLPAKLSKSANVGVDSSPLNIQKLNSLRSLLGSGNAKREARNLWRTVNSDFIQPVTKTLPKTKFVTTENLIKKSFRSLVKMSAKDRLDQKKTRRETKKAIEHNHKQHQELKEKWKLTRQQRNNNLNIEDNFPKDLSQQQSIEYRNLQDYYSVLLSQTSSDREKIEAQFKLEQEKLNTKYEQLSILQESLTTIQKNFGKIAALNENSFDVIQEQIASSAELNDAKQSGYTENLSSDIEYLQETNNSNAEAIVDVITEGQELQTEAFTQLNSNIEEQNKQRDASLEETLNNIEQQQKERHIQQMYVLDNLGAEMVAAEQQREAQQTEQQYLYGKFLKKQDETKASIPGIIIGGLMGILNTFFKALANPQQMVELIASSVGGFFAEMMSFIQFLVGNTMYGLGHVFKSFSGPINSFLNTIFPPSLANALAIDQSLLKNMIDTAQFLPRLFSSLGLPDMTIMPPPTADLPKVDNTMAEGFWNLKNNFVETVKKIPEQIKADWAAAEGISGVAKFIASYAAPAVLIPAAAAFPALMPVAMGTLGAKVLTTAGGIERTYDPEQQKFVSRVKEVKPYGNVPKEETIKGASQAPSQPAQLALPESSRAKVIEVAKEPSIPQIDRVLLEKASSKQQKASTGRKEEFEFDKSSKGAEAEQAPIHIDNSTNYFNTFVTQQEDKQIAAGV